MHDAHIGLVYKRYSGDASSAGVDVQTTDDLDDCFEDVEPEVSVLYIRRSVDEEYDVGALSTVIVWFCYKFDEKCSNTFMPSSSVEATPF